MRRRGERGYVLAFLVIASAGLICFTGLTDDGGRALSGRLRAMDEAQAAARAGSERIDMAVYHAGGQVTLDQAAALDAAQRFLAATGDQGVVTVTGDRVLVTVSVRVPAHILTIVGIRSLTVSGDGEARADPRAASGGGP